MPNTVTTAALPATLQWLEAHPRHDQFFEISPTRAFAHPEEAYDKQYGNYVADYTVGQGVAALLRRRGCDTNGPALEIGCGTGRLTLGLVQSRMFPAVLITDPSPAFLRITREKLESEGLHDDETCVYGALSGEELDRLPAGTFSLIIMRSVLHHVLDVDAFVASAARALRPGGVLLCEEPFGEGFLLMGTLAQFIPVVMAQAGRPMSEEDQKKINFFGDTVRFYTRRDLDKSKAEDKHLFRAEELMQIGRAHGLESEFLPNFMYPHFVNHDPDGPAPFEAYTYLKNYLRYCMSFGADFVESFAEIFAPYARFIEECSAGWTGPHFHGVFLWRKPER
jgi:ubiquinone/menaquinone biosynthesis C-methylase UbiE